MQSKPSGNVTFLFTDIEGSTKLSQEFPETLQGALEKHHSILREAIESNNGFIFEMIGDAFCCAFEKAEDAVKAAIDAQINLSEEKCLPAGQAGNDAVIKVRMGIHSGNAEWTESGQRYMGYITLARTARVMSASYGEQIIISNDTYDLTRDKFDAVKEKNVSFCDLGERRLKDVIQPIRLYQLVSPGLREGFPPLKTLDARPNNLPVQLTSFIGREEVIRECKKLFLQTRLLTIIGSGGAGKTRLAMQVGAEMIDDFSEGVFMIELASVNDSSLLLQTVMNSFEIKEEPGRSLAETLTGYLKDKEMLLLLDNCEHLINKCADFAEMVLSKCALLKIIATSREALNCSGECAYRLPSMSLPDKSVNNSPEKLSQYESVRLFIERALLVNSNFRVNNNNAPALAEICSRLDGIPLAIELAAARIKVLPLDKLNERLDDRFKLLTGGKRTSLPRQQTLKALIDWSYDLLSEKEKKFWSRLSVFAGGWTLGAAEEVCSGDDLSEDDILDLMNELTDKSIVIFNETSDNYRMLETIRQYGVKRLAELGESETMKSNHLSYYLKMALAAEPELYGPKAKKWFEKFESEHSNIQAALTWSLEKKLYEDGNKLFCALDSYWETRGYSFESGIWLEKLMANSQNISPEVLARSNRKAGYIEEYRGNILRSKEYFEVALKIYRSLGNMKAASGILNALGLNAYYSGDYVIAEKCLEEGLQLCRELNERNTISVILNSLGLVELRKSKFGNAKIYFEESLEISREIGNENLMGVGLNNLAVVKTHLGEYEEAENIYGEVLKLNRELGDKIGIARTLSNLGNIFLLKNDFEKAQSLLIESLSLSKAIGSMERIVDSLVNLGQVALGKGEVGTAKIYFTESLILQKQSPDFQLVLSCLNGISAVKLLEDKPETAARLIGVIKSKLELSGSGLEASNQILYEKTLNALKNEIGNDCMSEELEKGKELTFENAIELALSDN